ncbi:MAG TPA: ribose 5-phosphate isomerase B [Chitinophagaceae bacterium]|nr:ribose 5-phosphate isomerase B [Chitinophagaceae bacterium]
MLNKIIPIGSDHAGFKLKQEIIKYFKEQGYEFKDFGTHSEESIDYPDYGHPVAQFIEDNGGLGIVICGSGNGINMTVNSHKGIRGALCWKEEIAELARKHNDANILSLPGRFISVEEGIKITEVFLNTEFEGGRHQRRIDKINCK